MTKMLLVAFTTIPATLMAGLVALVIGASDYQMAADGKPQIIAGYPLCSAANSWRCGE